MANPTTISNNVIDTMSMNTDQILPQMVRDIRNRDANIIPFTHLMRMTNKETIRGVERQWWETQQLPQWTKVNGETAADETSIVIDDPSYFAANDMLVVPRTGETMRILTVNVGTSTITVTRSMGATAATVLNNDEDLFRTGVAVEEHSLRGTAIMVKPVKCSTWLQIWRIPVEESETAAFTEKWTGDERARQRLEKRDLMNLEQEKTFLFGEKSETVGPNGHPLRTAGGLIERIKDTSLHYLGGYGTTTESVFRTAIVDAWDYASGPLYMFASNWFCDRIDTWGVNRLELVQSDDTYGVAIKMWKSTMGDLRIVNHKLLRGSVYGNYALIVDLKNCYYIEQAGQGMRLVLNIQERDRHGYVDEWRVTAGARFMTPESHQLLTGLS